MTVLLIILSLSTLCVHGDPVYTFFDANLVAHTQEGPVKGYFDQPNGGSIVFRGIPYAKNPPMRFQPPEAPIDRGDTLYEAFEFQSPCTQKDFSDNGVLKGSDDCLYVNIWVPGGEENSKIFRTTKYHKKPVIIAFHDGFQGFGSGADPSIHGSTIVNEKNVIWVTVNYRLGIWGFLAHPDLSSNSNGISGMYGALDQIQAVKWVKENIGRFGGDPDHITLYGVGGGSVAVATLLTYKGLKGYIKAAIMESPYLLWQKTLQQTQNYYENITNNNMEPCEDFGSIQQCLYEASNTQLCELFYPGDLAPPNYNPGDPFAPNNFQGTIFMIPTGTLTTQSILSVLKTCPPDTDVTLLIGHSISESNWYSNLIFPRSPILDDSSVTPLIEDFLETLFPSETDPTDILNAVNFVKAQYGNNWSEIVSDAEFVCSTLQLLNCTKYGGFDRVYHYIMNTSTPMVYDLNYHGSGNFYWTKNFYENKFGNATLPIALDHKISYQKQIRMEGTSINCDPNKGLFDGFNPLTGWPKWDYETQWYSDVIDFPIPLNKEPQPFKNCVNIWYEAFNQNTPPPP